MGIATEFGPRITSLTIEDSSELLARLGPEQALVYDGGSYEFRGGHRLWASPEIPAITYAPDDHECVVEERDGVVTITAPTDTAGLVKEIGLSVEDDNLVVDHKITRVGRESSRLAPWAITQLPLDGTAILPLTGGDTAPRANRYLVLWPYSSVEDGRVTVGDDVVEIRAADGPPLKFGSGPAPGRLGYFRDGFVFIKEIEPAADRTVPDFGAVGQIYLGQGFCELESVGELADLAEGEVGELRERWRVVDCGDLDSALQLTVDG